MSKEEFYNKKNIFAVVGVSGNQDKWGFKVYDALKKAGYKVYPINPKYEKYLNEPCFIDIGAVPEKIDVVVTVVRSQVTERVVRECKHLGMECDKQTWFELRKFSVEKLEKYDNN